MQLHLSESSAQTELSLGNVIEQWLGSRNRNDAGCELRLCTALNDGNEFTPVDSDSPEGVITTFRDSLSALRYAADSLGAAADRYVRQGVVQIEYASARRRL